MTNKERLLQDGSNCPYRIGETSCDKCYYRNRSVLCRGERVRRLSQTAKGRRWLDDECEAEK